MAKKKIPPIKLEGLDDVPLNKEPDIQSAMSIIKPAENNKTTPTKKANKTTRPKPQKITAPKPALSPPKGTLPPPRKKRASFNIDEDLHKSLKDYSYFNEIDMVEYVFEQLVKKDLAKKGYYPPCLLYTSPSPRDLSTSRMPSSA